MNLSVKQKQNRLVVAKWKAGRKIEKKKNFIPLRSNPTRVKKFKKKCKKILKIKKHHPGFISRGNGLGQAEK